MFVRAVDRKQALTLLNDGDWSILAGGTDFYPALNDKAIQGNILDITAIADLKCIQETDDYWRFHALTSWADIHQATNLPPAFHSLKQVAREVGSIQIQNRATMTGNLCTASPAGDGIPALLALDAEIEIASLHHIRHMKLADFMVGYRAVALEKNEMVSAILIPKKMTPNEPKQGISQFYKLGARKYLVISIAMSAVHLIINDKTIENASIAVGACSTVAQRIPLLEEALRGKKFDNHLHETVEDKHFQHLTPIDDVRATATYRRKIVKQIVQKTLINCVTMQE